MNSAVPGSATPAPAGESWKKRASAPTPPSAFAAAAKRSSSSRRRIIDLDALDPAFAPAVGNPEPFGLTSWDVLRVIERTAPKAVGLDINELTPAYDRGETALLAARLAREFIAAREAMEKGMGQPK